MAPEGDVVAWTTHSLDKVFMDGERPPRAGCEIHLRAARGEVEDAQVAVRVPPDKEIRAASFELSDLAGPGSARIDRECVEAHWEWYTHVTHNPPENTDPATYLRQAPAFFPDGFLEQDTIRILGRRTQPLWVSVRVPADARAGAYRGSVRLHLVDKAGEKTDIEVPVTLDVWPFELPRENRLRHTEWHHPTGQARHYRLEPWSEAHWVWIEKVAKDMGRHRQDMIATRFRELVDVARRGDGSLAFDFARLDRWVKTFAREGVTWIEGGHIGGRIGDWESDFGLLRFPVKDEGGAPIDTSREAMSAEEFDPIAERFLKACRERLTALGCGDRYVQHIADEPVPGNQDSWIRLSEAVKRWLPGVQRIDAVMAPGLEEHLEITVPQIQEITGPSTATPPHELWSYVCLAPQGIYPNRFLDYASIRSRIIFWLSWSLNLKGFLHWGYDYWSAWSGCPVPVRVSPWTDAAGASVYCQDKIPLPAGDPFLVYPGEESICSSIRWEVIRKGLEDFEYLCILEELARDAGAGESKGRAEALLDRVRRDIAPDPARHTHDAMRLLGMRDEVGGMICKLLAEQ